MLGRGIASIVVVFITAASVVAQDSSPGPSATAEWRSVFYGRLPQLGHRNWIAVVDSAYPAQTSAGIETLVTGGDQLGVVKEVLAALGQQQHVRPVIYLDAELDHVPAVDASGIDQYRADLAKLLGNHEVKKVLHASIIDKLDAAGSKFKVLVLKTNLTLPYTSVFIELDCGYWSPEAEARMRAAMKTAAPAEK